MAKDIRSAIEALGGVSSVARELGHKSHTSVQYWYSENRLPEWRWWAFAALAKRRGVPLPRTLEPRSKGSNVP